jgi:glycosyltransferase involved in cell wall biosynthesis
VLTKVPGGLDNSGSRVSLFRSHTLNCELQTTMKISVLIPSYNQAEFLPASLESLLEQNYDAWEAIVVNDGSLDGTKEIAESYSKRDKRIKTISFGFNYGACNALNTAFRVASGDWICWLSSDDLYENQKFSTHYQFFKERKIRRPQFTSNLILEGGVKRKTDTTLVQYLQSNKLGLFHSNYISGITPLVPREVFSKVGLFNPNYKYAADYDMWLKIMYSYGFDYIDAPLSVTRVHPEQVTSKSGHLPLIESAQIAFNYLNVNGLSGIARLYEGDQFERVKVFTLDILNLYLNKKSYLGLCGLDWVYLKHFSDWFNSVPDENQRLFLEDVLKALISTDQFSPKEKAFFPQIFSQSPKLFSLFPSGSFLNLLSLNNHARGMIPQSEVSSYINSFEQIS